MGARLAVFAAHALVGSLALPLPGTPLQPGAATPEAARQPTFDPAYAVGVVEARTPGGTAAIAGVLIAPDLVVSFLDVFENVREATFLPACCEELKVVGVVRIFEAQHLIVLRVERTPESLAKPMPVADVPLQVGEEVFYSLGTVRDAGVLATRTPIERVDVWPVEGALARVRASADTLPGGGVVYDARGRTRGMMIAADTPGTPLVTSIPPEAAEPEFELSLEEYADREPTPLAQARRQAREAKDLETRDSIRGMRAALSLEPAMWLTRRWLAAQLDVEGNQAAALKEIDAVIAEVPQYASAHQSRGLILAAMKRFEDAAAAFQGAIDQDPKFADAHAMRAASLAQLDRMDEAIEAGMRSIDVGGTELYFLENLIGFLSRAGRMDEAPKAARTFCDNNTVVPEAWFLLGRLYLSAGDREAAAQACRDGISFNGEDAELHLLLAIALEESAAEEKIKALEAFVRLAPDDHPALRAANEELERLRDK